MVLNIGDTERIAVAVVIPANATLKTFDWKSSNEKVASVSQTGEVKGVSAGTAVIMVTAKDGSGVTGSCTVTVKKKETVTPTPTPNPEKTNGGYLPVPNVFLGDRLHRPIRYNVRYNR